MSSLPRHRRLLFLLAFSLGLPALVLVMLEAGLRLAHVGHSPHFFRPAMARDGTPVWRDNRDALAAHFPAALVRRPQPLRLARPKAPATYRVFVLGSSAAMGDPEPSFSVARVLELMLRDAFPGQRIEVVNAAVTAINSHLVRDIATDCAALEPDAFVVYEGNNEVIGPYGPAGVLAPYLGSTRAIRATMALKELRLTQLISGAARRGTPVNWGGMELFLQQKIAATDPRLDAVRRKFGENLRAIAATAERAGALAVVCTVAVNQKDFAPFLSSDGAAEKAFQDGRRALAENRDAEARDFFQRAVDLDELRFRTDSALNRDILGLAANASTQLRVVDVAAALNAASPHGIAGNEFFYEHVHLNLRGTYEVAAAIFPTIASDLTEKRGLRFIRAPQPPPYSEIGPRLGFNTHEQALIAAEMLHRVSKPPFSGQSDHAIRLAQWQRWNDSAQALLARPDATAALRELSQRALAASPDDWILQRNIGAMLVSRHLPEEALPLLEKADAWIEDDVDTLVALGWAHRALGHTAEAQAAFARARALEPGYPNLPSN